MNWRYAKRSDGRVAITLDNNVWDFLFERNIDLRSEFPPESFAIYITREIEIEALSIPDHESKKALKHYIARTIEDCEIKTTSVFGFAHEGPGPERLGGFDVGVWQSQTETEFYAAIQELFLVGKSLKNSELFDNEADAAVAVKSFSSIALTCESPNKRGPLSFAAAHGGQVVYLKALDEENLTLRRMIEDVYRKIL